MSMLHSQELVPVLDRGIYKFGYKEKDKIDWSLQPVYEKANNFKDNVAAVNNGGVFYFIDLTERKSLQILMRFNALRIILICQ